MHDPEDPVVASLANRSVHPYSSVAMAANRRHAICAGKDTLQLIEVSPRGLTLIRSLRISQHFQMAMASETNAHQMAKIYEDKRGSFVRDTFGFQVAVTKQAPVVTNPHQSANNMAMRTNVNVVITDVAWSKPQQSSTSHNNNNNNNNSNNRDNNNPNIAPSGVVVPDMTMLMNDQEQAVLSGNNKKQQETSSSSSSSSVDSFVAAAGSNGVVVVWSAKRAFFEADGSASSMANQQPEAILSQHSRAVNRLAWHPRRPGLLLTASQDATVKLWTRRVVQNKPITGNSNHLSSWFRFNSAPSLDESYSWQCRATFEPKSEAVRDIRWSPFLDDMFALVTVSGCLIVYNMFVPMRPIIKISAHAGDATTLDWHPTKPFIIATGGASDRCVKIWNLESSLAMAKDDSNMVANSNTANSRTDSIGTESSSETDRSGYASSGSGHPVPTRSLSFSLLNSRSKTSVSMLHVLTVSATVTRLKWRPPALEGLPVNDDNQDVPDRHESMLAVATGSIKGASAGGSGLLALWSYHRPFQPLSVLSSHTQGAVTDFFWLDTPHPDSQQSMVPSWKPRGSSVQDGRKRSPDESERSSRVRAMTPHEAAGTPPSIYEKSDTEKKEVPDKAGLGVWQHVLSVGRDGRCLLQSFARGDKPISRVPPSCFALANKSPFSRGFGSLQICSVHQNVPSGPQNEFWLAGLRRDQETSLAPGVFREVPAQDIVQEGDKSIAGKRLPDQVPELVFNVVDRGDLEGSTPRPANQRAITVAPEVVHLSRFAKAYKLHPDQNLPSRVDLCLHNSAVAESLQCGHLSRMWKTVAQILEGSFLDGLPEKGSQPENAMQFVLLPTIKALLLERADAGDVQTCVTLCEVLQVIEPNETTRIPGLSLNLVREWYLAYIDLLRDMCLFSLASLIIGTCKDSFVGALNQQSTTIHESCPRCGKALAPQPSDGTSNTTATARRECKSCRRRIGLCFLCHEPVKGMFVWCPGCGHGGHLDHALQWFGGLDGRPVREVCPTGCGHKCNFMQQLSAFPRTGSLLNMAGIGSKLGGSSPRVDMLPAGLM